jgi:orotidine-5'-phosphate decarboxylase
VALDFADARRAVALAERLQPNDCRLKVGKELFVRGGPELVRQLVALGFDVFLDLKFHDIPNTVASACRAAAELGVWMVNVHALGGRRMLEAAREALRETRPQLVAVTILTSLETADLAEVGIRGTLEEAVIGLAKLAEATGLDGVVCSARELVRLRAATAREFVLVTPGIRPQGADWADQRRVTTPTQAISRGADYLVVGRPITAAPEPVQALESLRSELALSQG